MSELIQPTHLKRKAVVYIRQSTPHQVVSRGIAYGFIAPAQRQKAQGNAPPPQPEGEDGGAADRGGSATRPPWGRSGASPSLARRGKGMIHARSLQMR